MMLGGLPQRPPAPAPAQGGADPTAALQRAISAVHDAAIAADDQVDKNTLLQCLAKIQGILASEQKEKESALGTTPAHKFVQKAQTRGGGY